MSRATLVALLFLAALLLACGEQAADTAIPPSATTERETADGGAFLLEVGPDAVPGKRLPVAVTGDAAGVTLTVFKIADPAAAIEAAPDPRSLPDDFPLDGLEEIVQAETGPDGTAPLPWLHGGLYVVEARRGRQRAMAMLPVSDLVLVTKRARDETLVFVTDAETGAPIPGARVVVIGPNGRAEGPSDAQGVFRRTVSPGPRARVLATAGDRLALATPEHYPAEAQGPLAYVYTDRPAYRPGETVHFKCIHRVLSRAGYRPESTEGATFRAIDARGNEVAAGEVAEHGAGSCWGSLTLPDATALGTARIEVVVGETAFAGEVTVEEFVRPSFEVLVAPAARTAVRGDEVAVTVRAAYFAGGALAGAQVLYRVTRSAAGAPIDEVLDGEAVLDATGTLTTRVEASDAGVYRFSAEVTDRAGTIAGGEASIAVAPAEFSLEVETDMRHYAPVHAEAIVSVIPSFPTGREVPVAGVLTVGEQEFPFELTPEDAGQVDIPVRFTGIGRYAVAAVAQDGRGNGVRAEGVFWVSAGGDVDHDGEGILVLPDAEEYGPGETARILVLLPRGLDDAALLETVEGTALGTHTVVRVRGRSHVAEIPLPSRLGTRIVLAVAAVKGGRVHRGSATVRVPPRDRLLTVTVRAEPAEVRPGEAVEAVMEVTGPDGEPAAAEVSLAVYDDAITALYPDAAPSIEEFFFGRTRHDVATDSSRTGLFLGRTSGGESADTASPDLVQMTPMEESQPLFGRAEGGEGLLEGEDETDAPPRTRADFAALAYWTPSLPVSAEGGIEPVSIRLPDSLTRWRLVAVAATPETRVGAGVGYVRTALPVAVRLSLPRFLVEGDVVVARAAARNDLPDAVSGTLRIEPRGLVLVDPDSRAVRLPPGGGEADIDARLTARRAGEAGVTGELLAEVGDRVERTLPVLPHALPATAVASGTLKEGRTLALIDLPREARREDARLTIALSSGPVGAVLQALPTLIDYPHGCTEQTLSRFVPDVAALAAVRELEIEPPPEVERAEALARVGLGRLYVLQHEDGGWGWWREDESDVAMTADVVAGLALTERAGVLVSAERIGRAQEFLRSRLVDGAVDDDPEAMAAALHALAVSGGEAGPHLDRLFDSPRRLRLPPGAAAKLMLALHLSGRAYDAGRIAEELHQRRVEDDWGRCSWGRETAESRGEDPVEATAVVLRALLATGETGAEGTIDRAVRFLLETRVGPAWKSTRDTAAAVLALVDAALAAEDGNEGTAVIRIRVGDGLVKTVSLDRADLLTEGAVVEAPAGLLRPGRNQISFVKSGKLTVRFSARLDYLLPREEFRAESHGLEVSRETMRLPGRLALREEETVELGDILVVSVTVRADRERRFVVADCPIPAGTEAVRDDPLLDRLDLFTPLGAHVERHDERVLFFLPSLSGERTLAYVLRVTHSGRFRTLPATASLMYFPRVRGSSDGEFLYVE